VLKEAYGQRRIQFNGDQRRRLAVKGRVLGRKVLGEIGAAFSPDTILRWHRQLVAEKWDYSERRRAVGSPRVKPEIVELVLRMARENPTWGYDRIQDGLANLGHKVSDTTIGSILREHGIEPVRERKRWSTWKEFLEAHWDTRRVATSGPPGAASARLDPPRHHRHNAQIRGQGPPPSRRSQGGGARPRLHLAILSRGEPGHRDGYARAGRPGVYSWQKQWVSLREPARATLSSQTSQRSRPLSS